MIGRRGVASVLLLASAASAAAQTGPLRGQVTDATDGRALPGASVQLEGRDGTRTGVAAGADGFFVFARIAPGTYILTVSFVGYVPFVDTVAVGASRAPLEVALRPEPVPIGEVTVRDVALASLPDGGRLASVRPADVRGIPALTPASDLAAYLVTLPAFTPTADRGGQVSVRGGEPTQNLFLVDGIPIYQPYHVLGEFSVVPGDALAVAEVYAGAFPARHGGRIASVVDATLRSGNKERFEAHVSAAPLLSALQLEGPLVPGKVSFLLSARESFVDRVGLGLPDEALPFRFGDRLGRVHAYLTRTSSLSATALHSTDVATLQTGLGEAGQARWTTTGAGLRFVYLPTSFPVLAEIEAFGTRLDSYFDVPGLPGRRSLVEEGGGAFGFRYLLGGNEVRFGIQARTDHLLAEEGTRQEEYLTEGAFYADAVLETGAFRFEPGLRLSTFPSRSRIALEPRLRVEWTRGMHRVQGGAAVVHQEIGGRYASDDLSDAFVAWVPTPSGTPLPRAEQVVLGWSVVQRGRLVALDAYHRRLRHLGAAGDLDGYAQGLEARAEVRRGGWLARLGGALSAVRYRAETGDAFPPPPDRPLRFDAQVSHTRGGLEASVRWFYTDGAAFTPLRGLYREVPVFIGSDAFLRLPGTRQTVDGAPGSRRLPSTHRLDLSLAYRRAVGPLRLAVHLAVRNAYDRANAFYLNRLTGERYDALPRTVALGVRIDV